GRRRPGGNATTRSAASPSTPAAGRRWPTRRSRPAASATPPRPPTGGHAAKPPSVSSQDPPRLVVRGQVEQGLAAATLCPPSPVTDLCCDEERADNGRVQPDPGDQDARSDMQCVDESVHRPPLRSRS